jgi:hypothetical protein
MNSVIALMTSHNTEGVDSYLIFCAGEGRNITPNDKNLRAFATWLKSVGDDDGVGVVGKGAELGGGRGAPPPPVFVKAEPAE